MVRLAKLQVSDPAARPDPLGLNGGIRVQVAKTTSAGRGGEGLPVEIVWTTHAYERQAEWEKKRGITREQIERLVKDPEQIAPGYRDALVAQARSGGGLLRVPFVEVGGQRKLLTVYWTSCIDRYWVGGLHADPI